MNAAPDIYSYLKGRASVSWVNWCIENQCSVLLDYIKYPQINISSAQKKIKKFGNHLRLVSGSTPLNGNAEYLYQHDLDYWKGHKSPNVFIHQ